MECVNVLTLLILSNTQVVFSSHSLEASESQEKGDFCAARFLLLHMCEWVAANVVIWINFF